MSLADNIWWTRKARIQTEKRLLSNALCAQLLLLWYSFFSVFAALYYTQVETAGRLGNFAWIAFSVLTLLVSGFINGLSFKERASLVKECYETLNDLYHRAKTNPGEANGAILKEYGQILNICENHTSRDFRSAVCEAHLVEDGAKLSKKPTKYVWFLFWSEKVWALIIYLTLFSLPVGIFAFLEYYG